MDRNAKIYVAGHNGLVGRGVVRALKRDGFEDLVLRSRSELDLSDQIAVSQFFKDVKPDYVIDCAAKVGGIKANMTWPYEFLLENLQIQNNLITQAKEAEVKKFLFLGSSCIYPRDSKQPMREDYFMEGKPEPTNQAYAYAKICGMKLCEFVFDEFGHKFISCMPTNIYGPHDNFDPEKSHVIPGLMKRIHDAKIENASEVVIWGTGVSRREFLHVDDLSDAILFLMENYEEKPFLNIGTGEDVSIKELAELLKEIIGYKGALVFDSTKPDGMPKKLLDVSKINELGWKHQIALEDGLISTYEWYTSNY